MNLTSMMIRRLAAALAVVLTLAPVAHAQSPAWLFNPSYGFPLPGHQAAPSSASSAGVALADRWLGETSFENPAAALPKGMTLQASPLFQRVNRQDVVSLNRGAKQTMGYPDAASGLFGVGRGPLGLAVFAWQPVLRLEQLSYESGPLLTPAQVSQQALQRELHAGVAVSYQVQDALRLGVSGTYVRRDDSYETHEQSGSPLSGDRTVGFRGNGFGASLGVVYTKDPEQPWGSTIGAAIRWDGDLSLKGHADENLLTGDTTYAIATTRKSAISGGVSGRVLVSPSTWIVAGLSRNAAESWSGFGTSDVTSDAGLGFGIGLIWKDAEMPWGVRFGLGQETSPGARETKSGLASAGFNWVSGGVQLDLGVMHRNLAREGGFPRSADDRILATVRVAF